MEAMQMVIGVDEAGRGPLAGPVAVGLVYLPSDFEIKRAFPGVTDSKLLSEEKREELFERLELFSARGMLSYTVVFSPPEVIDTVGITKAVERAIHSGIRRFKPHPAETTILLDGLLHAPRHYTQQTIIGGDLKEPVISLASIAAKVVRDRRMHILARRYPKYGFEVHKGYATKAHQEALNEFGLCEIHRRSFCKKFLA